MEKILVKQTEITPKVVYNEYNNEILIKGKAIPFESDLFWSMVIHQIKNLQDENNISKIKIDLHHINTNSIIYLYKLLNTTDKTLIEWVFEDGDEDMCELGEYLSFLCKKTFIFLHSELC